MKKGKRKNGLAMSVPAGLLCSGILSLVLTAGVSMALGKLVELQLLAENQIGYAVMIMLVAISFAASEFAWHKIKRRCVLVCLITGVVTINILSNMYLPLCRIYLLKAEVICAVTTFFPST